MFSKNKQRCLKFGLMPKKGTKILNVLQVSAGFSTQIITCTFPFTADGHKSRAAACYGQYIQGNSSTELIFVCHNRRTSYFNSFKLLQNLESLGLLSKRITGHDHRESKRSKTKILRSEEREDTN